MKWISALIVLSIALAGCSSGDGDDGVSDTETQTSGTTSTSGTSTSATQTTTTTTTTGPAQNGTKENRAPSIGFTSDVSQGEAPLQVQFSIEGSDPDGDDLAWTLRIDGEVKEQGNGLPANVSWTFEEGTYNVTASINDGDLHRNASITITAAAAAAEVPGPIIWSGSAIAADSTVLFGCIVFESSDGGIYLYYDKAISGVWHYDAAGEAPGGFGMVTEWWDGDSGGGHEPAQGVIPAGTDNVAVCPEIPGIPGDFVLTLYHPDYVL